MVVQSAEPSHSSPQGHGQGHGHGSSGCGSSGGGSIVSSGGGSIVSSGGSWPNNIPLGSGTSTLVSCSVSGDWFSFGSSCSITVHPLALLF
jgi:hypothetical protein